MEGWGTSWQIAVPTSKFKLHAALCPYSQSLFQHCVLVGQTL